MYINIFFRNPSLISIRKKCELGYGMGKQVKLDKHYATGGARYANQGPFKLTAHFFYGLKWDQKKQKPQLSKEFSSKGLYLTEIGGKDPIIILAINSTFHSISVIKEWHNFLRDYTVFNSGDTTFHLGCIPWVEYFEWESRVTDVCRRLHFNWGRVNLDLSPWVMAEFCLGFDADDKPRLFYGVPIQTDLEERFEGLKQMAERPPLWPVDLIDLERISSLQSVDDFTSYLEEICGPIKFLRQRRYEGHPYCIYLKDTFRSSGEFDLPGVSSQALTRWDKLLQEGCDVLGFPWRQPTFHLFSSP